MPPDLHTPTTAPDGAEHPALAQPGYADAVAELEEILAQLDGDDVDVDHLAAQVRRAATLITLCRDRLTSARLEVTRIVADLDTLTAAQETADPEEDESPIDEDPGR